VNEATEPASRDLRRRYREIYQYVRRRSRSDSDAEDVTQDVFADAARALGSAEPGEGLPVGWLYAVAQRRLIDRARRQARRQEVFGDTALELVAEPPSEYGAEVSEALRTGIDRLPRASRPRTGTTRRSAIRRSTAESSARGRFRLRIRPLRPRSGARSTAS
jgi:RNA polymerase sigma-70 factor (ECF subfamily)